MKKFISVILVLLMVLSLCGCDFIANEKNSIGKAGNTVKTVYTALEENFEMRKMEGYRLYGARLLVNIENVGTYTYIYTDKRPDELTYSDILMVEVNNRTGRIEKFSAPDYEEHGSDPFDVVKTAMPLDPSALSVDSDAAIKKAAAAHRNDTFVYNYIELELAYEYGRTVYNVHHISLVNNCIYVSTVDAMTGDIISKSVEEL